MPEQWTLEKINQLITDKVQENIHLDYKAADSLGRGDKKKDEITKDVSAMANSDGGIIIYGVKEDQEKKQFPGTIDPINPKEFSKEWLEQVINNIQPKIDGIIIYPVTLDDNNVIYVVEIPKSNTAHQSNNKRYYKRFNFESEPMEDYEIRDVMSRNQYPKFELSFYFERTTIINSNNTYSNDEKKEYSLYVTAKNTGFVYAKYVNAFFLVPWFIVDYEINEDELIKEDDICYYKDYEDNTKRDYIGYNHMHHEYGPSWFDPILPGLSKTWKIPLKDLGKVLQTGHFSEKHKLKWTIYADNAIPQTGEIHLAEIDIKGKKEGFYA